MNAAAQHLDRIGCAFAETDRALFVLPSYASSAYDDRPLPIGYGQTISQPTTVRRMLMWLDAQPGQRVLDVGSGSGWTTALLAHLVGPQGMVYGVEIVDELVAMGQESCEKLALSNVSFSRPDDEGGLVAQAPYDRILVSASADEIPHTLREQTAVGGKLVIPVEHAIVVCEKTENGWIEDVHEGYVFVPYR